MKHNQQNKISVNLKNNRFKLRHAPYLNRCGAYNEKNDK